MKLKVFEAANATPYKLNNGVVPDNSEIYVHVCDTNQPVSISMFYGRIVNGNKMSLNSPRRCTDGDSGAPVLYKGYVIGIIKGRYWGQVEGDYYQEAYFTPIRDVIEFCKSKKFEGIDWDAITKNEFPPDASPFKDIFEIHNIQNIADISGSQNIIVIQGITNSNVNIQITVAEKQFFEQKNLLLTNNTDTLIKAQNFLLSYAEKIKADTSEIKELVKEIIKKLNAIPKILTIPPFIPSVFEGRDEELKAVHDKLFGGQNFVILINGQGGIGKTSFAAKYWERYQDEYHHLAFLYVNSSIANSLLMLEKWLKLDLPPETPTSERLNQVSQSLAKLEKPSLLILDNVNNKEDLDKNICLLRSCPNLQIIITSRLAYYVEANKHMLGSLSRENALKVFKLHYQSLDEEEEKLFDDFYSTIDGNTLILELFAKNLNNLNTPLEKKYSLQNLLDEIKNCLLTLSKSNEVQTAYHINGSDLRKEKPEAIILSMYETFELSDIEQQLMSVFAVLPAVSIPYQSLKILLKIDTNKSYFCTIEDLDKHLMSLYQKGWIEFNEKEKSFKICPVVQEIVRFKNKNRLLKVTNLLLDNLIEQLRYEGKFLVYHTLDNAAPYVYYAESVFKISHENSKDYIIKHDISVLAERKGNYYELIGKLDKALECFNLRYQLTKELYKANPKSVEILEDLAISYYKMAMVYKAKGDRKNGRKFFDEWKKIISYLAQNFPQIPKYQKWNNIKYKDI